MWFVCLFVCLFVSGDDSAGALTCNLYTSIQSLNNMKATEHARGRGAMTMFLRAHTAITQKWKRLARLPTNV